LPVWLDGLLDASDVLGALLERRATVLAVRADPEVGVTPEMLVADAEQALAADHALPARRIACCRILPVPVTRTAWLLRMESRSVARRDDLRDVPTGEMGRYPLIRRRSDRTLI